jgi:hypothetical protein
VDPEEVEDAIRGRFLADNDAADLATTAAGWRVEGLAAGAPPDRTDVWVVQPSAVEGSVIEDPMTVQVLDYVPLADGDLALLKANGLPAPTPPLAVATQQPELGDPLTAIGYPGSVMRVADVSRLRASFKTGTVSSSQVTRNGVLGTEINAQVSSGMSGGPTVDAAGHVLGVNSFGILGEEQSFNFITDAAALRSYLEGQGVDVRVGSTPDVSAPAGDAKPAAGDALRPAAAGSSLPAWPYLAGGGAGALLLAAGGAFLLGKRASRRPATPVPFDVAPAGPVGRPVPCGHDDNARDARSRTDCGTAVLG